MLLKTPPSGSICTLHDITLSDAHIARNFGFADNNQGLSASATDRIFDYAERLVADKGVRSPTDMWSVIASHKHVPLIECCIKRQRDEFAAITVALGKTDFVFGFTNYQCFTYEEIRQQPACRNYVALQFTDKLLSLGEYLCLIRVLNPEQGPWKISDPDCLSILGAAFSKSGQIVRPPSVGGVYGMKTNVGTFTERDLHAWLTTDLIATACEQYGLDEIAEIGGGMGLVAYYTAQTTNRPYVIYDLPAVSLIQAQVLMRSLGEKQINLYGERMLPTHKVCLRPYWQMFADEREKTLWLNQDSLPEIEIGIARKYMERISRSRSSCFLSINQEAKDSNRLGGEQLRVPELTKEMPQLVRKWRGRDFLRHGWIEEFYVVRRDAPGVTSS